MTNAAFKAAYADWKLIKTRSVIQVVLEIPLEQADLAYQVLGGMPLPASEQWVAIARLNGEDSHASIPVEAAGPALSTDSGETPDRPHKPRNPVAADKRLAQQAGICCADPVFQQFLLERGYLHAKCEEEAAKFVREHCHAISRAEMTYDNFAGKQWQNLHGQFLAWKLVDAA